MNNHAENARIEEWLARETPEPVLEPGLPIIDAHHHLWDLRKFDVEPFRSFQQKVYLCEEFSDDIDRCGHNIVQTVYAQCNAFYRADGPEDLRPVGETEFVNGIAAMSRSGLYGTTRLCTGIFSAADLQAGKAVERALLAHLNASPNFRGVRVPFPQDLNDQFLAGYALLSRYDLSFDNYSPDWRRLPTLARLADAQPDVTIIVNHLGGRADPDADPETFRDWQRCLDSLAGCANVVVKLGGAQQRVGPWEPPFHMNRQAQPLDSETLCERLFPWYQHALQTFGPDRCMFESNFPVDKECVSYRTLWNLFKRIAARAGLSDTEKHAVFSGTAARVYRLPAIQ